MDWAQYVAWSLAGLVWLVVAGIAVHAWWSDVYPFGPKDEE